MPLHEGKSKKVISENIREMEASGHPHNQAVAAALHNAHPNGGKNMAEGGSVSDADERSPDYPTAKMTGMPPEVLSTLMSGLMGGMNPISAAKEIAPALEGLGETGSVIIGKVAPKMEEAAETAAPKVEAFIKGVQKSLNGNEVKIWGVRGDPDEIAKLGYGSDPGSVPEHVLRAKGVLPETVNVPSQTAPNAYAEGGKVERTSLAHPEPNAMMARAMNEGGYPHVTFLENESPATVNKVTHVEHAPKTPATSTETGEKENPKHMAAGGTVHKAEDRNKEPAKPKDVEMSHEKKLASIYKAMGIKKYADGGAVMGDVDASQLPGGIPPPPPSGDPSFMDWLKTFGGKLLNSPAATVAGAAMNPVSAISDAVKSAAPAIMKAEGPAVTGVANAMTGGATPTMAPATMAAPAIPPVTPPVVPPVALPKPAIAPTATGLPAPATNELDNLFNQDTSKLTAGINAEDRNALVNKIGAQQHGLGSIIAEAVAGLGDALAAKGGREQHSLQGIFSMQKEQRDEALANFDKARQDRLQKLALQTQMGNNSIQKLAAQDAYGTDEHLNKMLGAPPGTAHKDLPLYFQMKSAQVAQQEKDADLYMKAHAQAANEVDAAVKNASVLSIKPSSAQIEASGAKLADQYFNRAKGNVLVKPSDGGQAQWIPAQNLGKARQMDPNLQVQP